MNNHKAKMKDVADLAGVSIKTVSRVLNNEPHVQEKLRTQVRDAVTKLGYVPSQSARSLRGNKSYDINLICHAAGGDYISVIQFGAVIACQKLGYQLSLSLLEGFEEASFETIKSSFESILRHHKPDGIMLVAPYAGDEKIGFVLEELGIPVVRIGPVELLNQGILVEIDDYKASIELTQHLVKLGHKKIGFVRGVENQRSTHVRYSGFCVAMNAAGLTVDPDLVAEGEFSFQSGYDAGLKLLAKDNRPTAIFASNDDMAAGVVTAANMQGLNVPNDLSVVGFDDAAVAVRMRPELTTIRQPLQELGQIAIETLVDSLTNNSINGPQRIVLDYEFVLRGTTAQISGETITH